VYPVKIESEGDLTKEIARVANTAEALGYRLEDEKRVLTKDEAYEQLVHSTSLFKAVLEFTKRLTLCFCMTNPRRPVDRFRDAQPST
jgi:hypothetical protein